MINEKFSNWYKAYKTHDRIEKSTKNHMWKARHLIAAGIGAHVASSLASKDYASAAIMGSNAIYLSKNHIDDIKRIKKKLDKKLQTEAFGRLKF